MSEQSGHNLRHRDMALEVARRWAGAPARDGLESSLLPLIVEACSGGPARTAAWHVEPGAGISQRHIRVRNSRAEMPEQGWKLHVSADVKSAETVLRRALSVLLAEDASFEVVASVVELGLLNKGMGSPGRIGKFITVYPKNDAQAVRLAVALDEATRGLSGPPVLSDRPLASGGLVHYRYESFTGRIVQSPSGEIQPAIFTPAGKLVPDRRPIDHYYAVDWVEDPFLAAGVATEPEVPSQVIGERYVIIETLHRSPRGEVYRALDVEAQRPCVLKKRQRSARGGGRDTRDYLLRNEAAVLSRLAPDPRFPAVFGLVEQDGDLFLAMEYVEGEMLDAQIAGPATWGRYVPGEQVATWVRELAAMLGTIHEEGLVYRDLKPNNVAVAPDGRLRLIDFEHACEAEAVAQFRGVGTRGYRSPQQVIGEPPAVTDDVYSLGALLYAAVTSTNVALAPHPLNLLERPIELLNPGAGPALIEVISRCLDPDPAARFPSMAALDAALAKVGAGASVAPAPFGGEPTVETETDGRRHRELAKRLGDTLCKEAQRAPEGRGLMWISESPDGRGMPLRDLHVGGAGAVLVLAELAIELGESQHRTALAEGAHWLKGAPYLPGQPLPGLYVGEAGVGAALLRAGQVLSDGGLVDLAVERGRGISSLPHGSPDMFNGTAGRLRFHLLLWDETNDPEHLHHAVEAGEFLLERAEEAGAPEGLCWKIPPGYGPLSGLAFLGYAHGAAGIAAALLDLFEATEDDRFLSAARGAGRWLARLAVPVLDDHSGLDWPHVEGRPPAGAAWCHGATGVGRFFLRAAKLDVLPEAADLAARAARTVARGARSRGPIQYHGLAGNIEFLLDMFQTTRDRAYLAEARSLARLLEAFAQEQDGVLAWPSDSPHVYSPDYMTGYAGVAVCLLRLSDPERLPHQLSREGFRRGQASSGSVRGRIPDARA